MGFGLKVDVPKVEVPKPAMPKVDAPKLDVAGALGGAAAGLKAAASGAAGIAGGAMGGVKGALGGALAAAGGAAMSLASVAGALAEVAVSFKGGTADVAMEPHMVLDANAGFEETKFEKGPVRIRVDLAPEKARASADTLHLVSGSGGFDRQIRISAFQEEQGKTVDVVFEQAPMDQSYSLDVIDGQGRTHSIFKQVPYGDLRKTRNRY